MAYQALYRVYRPKTFAEVVGQGHIVQTLQNVIKSGKIGHAYLFTGPRGTGKTSVAQIFARAINLSASGQFLHGDLDIIEIDAASHNGVAEVRTLIDSARYAPSEARYKVYIIDEVHMLSKGAFNALLKTLEEPPAHIVFILATTEVYKLPVTILSRCQRFNFRRIENATIVAQLKVILAQEQISFDEETTLGVVARLADGSLRDALSIADQVATFNNGAVTNSALLQVYGVVAQSNLVKLLNLAAQNAVKAMLSLLGQLLDNGADLDRVAQHLFIILKDYIIYRKTGDARLLEVLTLAEVEQLNFTLDWAYQAAEVLIKLIADLKYSEAPRAVMELAFITLSKKVGVEEVAPSLSPTTAIKPLANAAPASTPVAPPVRRRTPSSPTIVAPVAAPAPILTSQPLATPLATADSASKPADITAAVADFVAELQVNPPLATTTEIINLLIVASKEKLAQIKMRWVKILGIGIEPRFTRFANLLYDTKPIAAGSGFVLVGAENDVVVEALNVVRTNSDFLAFLARLFEEPLYLFVITRAEFDLAKQEYQKLRVQKALPVGRPIVPPVVIDRSEVETYASDLFGEIFKT